MSSAGSTIHLQKQGALFSPAGFEDFEIAESIPASSVLKCKYTLPRNYKFHRKFFALCKFAYDNWEPDETAAKKSFERFRKDLMILAGYYTQTVSLITSQIHLEAESIAFGNMSEAKFSQVYKAVKDVVWDQIFKFKNNYTQADYDRVINQLWSYD